MEVAFVGYFLVFGFDLFYLAGDDVWGSFGGVAVMVEEYEIYAFLEEFLFLGEGWWDVMLFQSFFHHFCHVFQFYANKLMLFYLEAILIVYLWRGVALVLVPEVEIGGKMGFDYDSGDE